MFRLKTLLVCALVATVLLFGSFLSNVGVAMADARCCGAESLVTIAAGISAAESSSSSRAVATKSSSSSSTSCGRLPGNSASSGMPRMVMFSPRSPGRTRKPAAARDRPEEAPRRPLLPAACPPVDLERA